MKALNIDHNPQEWRLFVDSSKPSLKASDLPSVLIGYASFSILNSSADLWEPQGGCSFIRHAVRVTKFCCFICEWDSRAPSLHYSKKDSYNQNPSRAR
ncbi:hypothetical protein PR048_018139 [Dryococelus australis]|uniref:Uncharacterized protein n=1 Tax=Dryococelus australis TaxID=614101 RepID=A0ABQ9HBF7_9NEOP|nr:hypothetical protein PR048_018139 [Dryococelus australis]